MEENRKKVDSKTIKVISKTFELPEYKTNGSAGFDIQADTDGKKCLIKPNERIIIKTGLYFELPQGYELQIRSRSGLALKKGIIVLNQPGTIDSDYRGEVGIILYNTSDTSYEVNHKDRIAQGVISQYEQFNLEKVTELSDTERGSGGFGSTGV